MTVMVNFPSELGGDAFGYLLESNAGASQAMGAETDFTVRALSDDLYNIRRWSYHKRLVTYTTDIVVA